MDYLQTHPLFYDTVKGTKPTDLLVDVSYFVAGSGKRVALATFNSCYVLGVSPDYKKLLVELLVYNRGTQTTKLRVVFTWNAKQKKYTNGSYFLEVAKEKRYPSRAKKYNIKMCGQSKSHYKEVPEL